MKVCLRFSTQRWDIASALIRWRTECKHSHVEFEYEDGWTLGARFSLRGKIARWLGWPLCWIDLDGVQFRPPRENRKQVNVLRLTYPGIDQALDWFHANRLHAPYDLLGIIGIATARGWDDSHDNFCSEGMAEAAASVGIKFQNLSPQATTPRDIEISLSVSNVLA